jgi:hypothetical protein
LLVSLDFAVVVEAVGVVRQVVVIVMVVAVDKAKLLSNTQLQ